MPDKMFPFDSGAFERELYKRHFHPDMKLGDFMLNGSIVMAGKLVTRSYGSNNDYYTG
jgi:hypothetical protein